ncbi:hypothetical protein V8F20_011212 [Naviculisporaceae sp. PSN 640]
MKASRYTVLGVISALSLLVKCHKAEECPPLRPGKITIDAFQLYPENMDWDPILCQAYISILYNSSIGIFSPYATPTSPNGTLSILPITPFSQTLNPNYHIAGIVVNSKPLRKPGSHYLSAITTQALAFRTAGRNISGNNFLNRYDLITKKFLWSANLTTVSKNRYGGFNDLAYDSHGSSFVAGTFPSSILKVDPTGNQIEEWYLSPEAEFGNRTVGVFGYTGIASLPEAGVLLTVEASTGSLYRFDMAAEKGVPVKLVIEGMGEGDRIVRSDAMRLPEKYGGKVLLITDQRRGVVVLRSITSSQKGNGKKKKAWERAKYLGLVPNDSTLPPGALTPAVSEMADRIYMVPNWFGERPIVEGTLTGNRSVFYLVDITEEVDRLVERG